MFRPISLLRDQSKQSKSRQGAEKDKRLIDTDIIEETQQQLIKEQDFSKRRGGLVVAQG